MACCEAEFPKLLHALDPPPPMLTMLGNPEHARPEAVAIIGARNASAAGRKIARDVAAELGRIGLAVIAGLGIDGEGHAASLASGTVAVLGGSIDHVYPPQHERLHARSPSAASSFRKAPPATPHADRTSPAATAS
ncbi:MAG TPA: DNA-processing protein DprA, partial [Hyphomonas sp.]|nr:DNA-processing protein DprA [Hyphomonas sp.]